MTSIHRQLAKKLSPKPEKTAAVPTQNLPGALGTIAGTNTDGTLSVVYNGTPIPCQIVGVFDTSPGNPVIVLCLGTQNWAFGPVNGGAATVPVPRGRAYASSGGTVTGGEVAVTLDTAPLLEDGMVFSTASGTGLQVPEDGDYLCGCQIALQNTGSYYVTSGLGVNNSLVSSGSDGITEVGAYASAVTVDLLTLNAGDIVNNMYVASDPTVPFGTGPNNCYLWVVKQG